jgi:predicted outer membrane repeat protein
LKQEETVKTNFIALPRAFFIVCVSFRDTSKVSRQILRYFKNVFIDRPRTRSMRSVIAPVIGLPMTVPDTVVGRNRGRTMQHECVRNQHLDYRCLLLAGLLIGGYSLAVQAGGPVRDCSTYGPPGAGTLEEALVGGGQVTFSCSGTIVVPEIEIAFDTTIDAAGQDVTLSRDNTNRVFVVDEGVTLDLNHVSIADGEASSSDVSDGRGGGIYAHSESTVTLSNVTVSNNHASKFGGGIYMAGGTLSLSDAIVSENHADIDGGGINAAYGIALTLTNTTVSHNHAGQYGGGINQIDGPLILTNATVSDNDAGYGGGIYIFPGALTAANTTLSGNNAAGEGGAIYASFSDVELVNTTVSENTAANGGGGIRATSGPLTLINTTLSDNVASGSSSFGGGIYGTGADFTLVSTTFSGNGAVHGGGFFYDEAVTVQNTIMTNSIGDNCAVSNYGISPSLTPLGENLVDDDSCDGIAQTAATGDGGINLGPLADNGGPTQTHALLSTSVAIDAVPFGECTLPEGTELETDQRGVTRPQGDACDVGAFELEVTPEPAEQCDLNGNGRFDLRDIVKFALGCRLAKATWLCDLTDDGHFNARDTILFVKNCHGWK